MAIIMHVVFYTSVQNGVQPQAVTQETCWQLDLAKMYYGIHCIKRKKTKQVYITALV